MGRFNILTTFYNEMSDDKINETIFCINNNLSHPYIRTIFIFLEIKNINEKYKNTFYKNEYDLKLNKKIMNLTKNNRINLFLISERPNFKDMFNFCNKISSRWIICNSDIYYPVWNLNKFKLLRNLNYKKKMIVLTRYNNKEDIPDYYNKPGHWNYGSYEIKRDNVTLKLMDSSGHSIDSWIFKTPIDINDINDINLDIDIGRTECDMHLNYQLHKIRELINPALSIISIHNHKNWMGDEVYYKVDYKNKIYNRLNYNRLMESKGHLKLNIPTSTIDLQLNDNKVGLEIKECMKTFGPRTHLNSSVSFLNKRLSEKEKEEEYYKIHTKEIELI